ncbi:MAG: hypothetical protein CK533_04365 [Acidobacterium sp.]|nr:hypothetical protein [Acidobacteriota bacterium]PHY11480.1 MAG: hypothetical protein CK533_04365 [Acidobacterium sp.]
MRIKALVALMGLALLAAVVPGRVVAQSDLDAFMERVLARRDDNWKKLQQYVLEEKEAFDLTGPGGLPLWGIRREYSWFIRQGIFVRSPVKANGVALSEADRRKAEDEWRRREANREERRQRRAERRVVVIDPTEVKVTDGQTTPADLPSNVDDLLKQGSDPQFVSSSYFLKFRFEKGHYALAGREKVDDRDALKIEYYPGTGLFNEGKSRPNRKVRDKEDEIEQKMNKVSLVTLWVDPKTDQILQYTFDDIDMDFFPGRTLLRVSDLKATMRMSQAFPEVWLPRSIEMHFGMMMAVGAIDATYTVDYLNYKQADVTYKIK